MKLPEGFRLATQEETNAYYSNQPIEQSQAQSATWGDVFTQVASPVQWWHTVGKATGGAIRAGEEITGLNMGQGEMIGDYHNKALAESALRISSDENAKRWVLGAGESLRQMAPAIGLGVVGGPAAALIYMSGEVAGTEYQDLREAGFGVGTSAAGAAAYGGAELAGEYFGMKALFGRGLDAAKKSARRKIMEYLLGENIGEQATTAIQSGVDKLTTAPDMSIQDFVNRMIDTAAITAIASPVGGGMAHYANKVRDNSLSPDERLLYAVTGTIHKDLLNTPASVLAKQVTDQVGIEVGELTRRIAEHQRYLATSDEFGTSLELEPQVSAEVDRILGPEVVTPVEENIPTEAPTQTVESQQDMGVPLDQPQFTPIPEQIPGQLESKPFTHITPEVQSQVDAIDAELFAYKQRNSQPLQDSKAEEFRNKSLKGRAMKAAADKRRAIQGDWLIPVEGGLTPGELESKIKAEFGTDTAAKFGRTGIYQGQQVRIVGRPFGGISFLLPDGTKKTLKAENVNEVTEITDNLIKEMQDKQTAEMARMKREYAQAEWERARTARQNIPIQGMEQPGIEPAPEMQPTPAFLYGRDRAQQPTPAVQGLDPNLLAATTAPVGTSVPLEAATDGVDTPQANVPIVSAPENVDVPQQMPQGVPTEVPPTTPVPAVDSLQGVAPEMQPPIVEAPPVMEPLPGEPTTEPQNIFDTIKAEQAAGTDVTPLVQDALTMGLQRPLSEILGGGNETVTRTRKVPKNVTKSRKVKRPVKKTRKVERVVDTPASEQQSDFQGTFDNFLRTLTDLSYRMMGNTSAEVDSQFQAAEKALRTLLQENGVSQTLISDFEKKYDNKFMGSLSDIEKFEQAKQAIVDLVEKKNPQKAKPTTKVEMVDEEYTDEETVDEQYQDTEMVDETYTETIPKAGNLNKFISRLKELFARYTRAGRPIYFNPGMKDQFQPQFGNLSITDEARATHELAHAGANESLNAADLETFLRWVDMQIKTGTEVGKAIQKDGNLQASEVLAILYDYAQGRGNELGLTTTPEGIEGIFQKIDAGIAKIQAEGATQAPIEDIAPVELDDEGRGPIIEYGKASDRESGRTNLRRLDAPEEVLGLIRDADTTQNKEEAAELDRVVLAIEDKVTEIKKEKAEGRPTLKLMADLEKLRKRERELRKSLKAMKRSDAVKVAVKIAKRFNATPQEAMRMIAEMGITDPEGILVAIDTLANEQAANTLAAHSAFKMNPTQENRYNYEVALARFLAMRKLAKGKIREYARALNFLGERRGVEMGEVENFAAALDALNQEFSDLNLKERADKHLQMSTEDVAKLTDVNKTDKAGDKVASKEHKATWREKLYQYWINSILSAVTTQAANIMSNTAILPLRIGEEFGTDVQRGGMSQAGQLALRNTATMLKTMLEISPVFGDGTFQKIWDGQVTIEGDVSKVEFNDSKSAIPTWMQTPTRLLETMDIYFKMVNQRMTLNGEAIRIAQSENLRGRAFDARVEELVANPTETMMDKANDDAKYYTFTNEMGEWGRKVAQFRDMKIGEGTLYEFQPGAWVVPFLRTPWNIAKFAGDRTPMKLALNVVNQLKGIKNKDGSISYPTAEEWSRSVIGTSIMLTAYMAAQAGFITGSGPEDKRERNNLRNTGWQPYALYFPGTGYVQYNRIEPFGALLGFAADMSENKGKGISYAGQVTKALATNFADKTFLKSATDLFEAFKEPDRKAQYFLQRQMGGLIPNFIAQTARATDPYLRQTDTYAEYMQSRIPGASNLLLPRLDQWGREVDRTGGVIQPFSTLLRFAIPMGVTADRANFTDSELARLNIKVGMPTPKVKMRGEIIDMSPQDFFDYVQTSGQESRTKVEGIMNSRMPDKYKEKAVTDAVNKSREKWRNEYLRKSR